jgi:LDH2 family malate/lactate/ureidoglycolate dehydrogenase
MFGAKAEIEANLSRYLQEVRESARAEGQERIYIHGEKEAEAAVRVKAEGVSLNEKTYAEMQMIAEYTGASAYLPDYLD